MPWGRLRFIAVCLTFVVSCIAALGVVLLLLFEATFPRTDFDCPDPLLPAGASGGPFGEAHWRWVPPEHYCDYSSIHPDWPDDLAIDPQPSVSKALLLALAPLAALVTGTELVGLAVARHRRTHPPQPALNLPPAEQWHRTSADS